MVDHNLIADIGIELAEVGKTRTLDDRLEEIAAVRFEDVNAWPQGC